MKNFDLLNNFVDDSGKPLHGKILFTERGSFGTSYPAKKKIYNSNETEIANPVFTDSLGKTETQVFVDGGDYSVWFFKYIGGGDMSTDVEEDNWELVDSLELVDAFKEVQTALDNGKMRCVDTIADLRSIDPSMVAGDVKIVAVKGYSVAGDKGVVYYKLNGSGTDNGGSCIQSSVNSLMYWNMVDGRSYVDVRDFGVFPDKGDSTNVGQITAAINYANSICKDVYFVKGNYKLNGGNFYINGNLVADECVSFTGKENTASNIRCLNVSDENTDLKLYGEGNNGYVTLTASRSRTSWGGGLCKISAIETLIVDNDVALGENGYGNPREVIFAKECHQACHFKSCNVNSIGFLGSNTKYYFTNCAFSDRMFKDFTFSKSCVLSGCSIDPSDFVNMGNYFLAKRLNGESIVDFGGRYCESITLNETTAYSYRLINANIGTLSFVNNGEATTERSIELQGCVVGKLEVYDKLKKFSAYDSRIADCACNAQDAFFSGCNIGGSYPIGSVGEPCKKATLIDSIVNGKVYATTLSMDKCTANDEVKVFTTMDAGDDVSFVITNCTFVSNGYIKLVYAYSNSLAFICNNNNFVGTNIGLQIDGNIKISNYSYEGNVGNCLQKKNSISFYTTSAYDLVNQPKMNIGQSYSLPVFGTYIEKVAVSVKFNGITATHDTMQLSAGFVVDSSTYKNFVVQANDDGELCYTDGIVVKPSFCTSELERGNIYNFGGICEIVVQVL